MKIVNPLYDQVFKYLMENEPIARKILSVIIEQEILNLQLKPQEAVYIDKKRNIPLSRFDFKAIIRSSDGCQNTVLIEIQKSNSPDPIMRFRRYLGKNYIRKETFITKEGKEESRPLPITTIYFLGYNLPEYQTPGILVNNCVIDAITKEPIETKNEFVKLLTHPSYILQINRLRPERKSRLEKLLSLFDQNQQTEDKYILDIEEDELPSDFKDIADYLNRATHDENFILNLEFEEDIEEEFEKREQKLLEQEIALQEKEKQLEQKDRQLEQKDRHLGEERKRTEEKEKENERLRNEIRKLKKNK
ncbi:MAG: hypothetical protein HY738_12505 [Bacteroidia bacterium]|nr:hypothetical protein [Bacteroidia bacterium]